MTTSEKPILFSREELELLIEMAGFDDPAPLTGRPEPTLTAELRPAVERGLLAKQVISPARNPSFQIDAGIKNLLTLCYYPDHYIRIDFRFGPQGISTQDSFFLFNGDASRAEDALRIHLYQQVAGVYRFERLADMPDLVGRVLATLQRETQTEAPNTAPPPSIDTADLICSIQMVCQGAEVERFSLMRSHGTFWEIDLADGEPQRRSRIDLDTVEAKVSRLVLANL